MDDEMKLQVSEDDKKAIENDIRNFGTGYFRVTGDGIAVRIAPERIYIRGSVETA